MADVKRFSEDFAHWIQSLIPGMRFMVEDPSDGKEYYLEIDKVTEGLATKEYVDNNRSVIIVNNQPDADAVFGQLLANVTYNVVLLSSNGNVFKNNIIGTTLYAVVYRGKDEVTSTIDANNFHWTRKSENADADILWNQSHFGGTKSIVISDDDVNHRATFQCDVTISITTV